MIIAKVILNQLLSLPPVLPEVGGILGSSNNVIDNVVFDLYPGRFQYEPASQVVGNVWNTV